MEKPYSVLNLAQRWGVSKPTIHNMIKDGRIENTFMVGNMLRIPAWEIERIESCGTQNQNSTGENTTPAKDQADKRNVNHYEPIDWMWQGGA